MGRELRDAIITIITHIDSQPTTEWGMREEKAMDVLRRAVSGWVPGDREETT